MLLNFNCILHFPGNPLWSTPVNLLCNKFDLKTIQFSPSQVFCCLHDSMHQERRDCVCLCSSRWKRHRVHYLTGFFLSESLFPCRDDARWKRVYTVQLPAPHVTDRSEAVKRAVIGLYAVEVQDDCDHTTNPLCCSTEQDLKRDSLSCLVLEIIGRWVTPQICFSSS